MSLRDWVRKGRELGASDLHLESETPLVVRVRGDLLPAGAVVPGSVLNPAAREVLGTEGWNEFLSRGSADVSRTIVGVRCRINIFQTVRGVGMAIRLLSHFQNNLRACNLHPDLKRLTDATTGLVVVSGPTGSGKSTTLAALIEEINSSGARNIIALESPIEYIFSNRRSFIRQREIPTHSPSFEQALVDALRENPDVLIVGEMRTAEVMRLTLSAAETGHLVIATMHSATCAEALTRMCMSFPADIQGSIRAQLADCFVGFVRVAWVDATIRRTTTAGFKSGVCAAFRLSCSAARALASRTMKSRMFAFLSKGANSAALRMPMTCGDPKAATTSGGSLASSK